MQKTVRDLPVTAVRRLDHWGFASNLQPTILPVRNFLEFLQKASMLLITCSLASRKKYVNAADLIKEQLLQHLKFTKMLILSLYDKIETLSGSSFEFKLDMRTNSGGSNRRLKTGHELTFKSCI
jgi:hypothetical protein